MRPSRPWSQMRRLQEPTLLLWTQVPFDQWHWCSGPHAAPLGIKNGVDVVITLTVVKRYHAVENNLVGEREFRVVSQAAAVQGTRLSGGDAGMARNFWAICWEPQHSTWAVPGGLSDTCATVPMAKHEFDDIHLSSNGRRGSSVTIFSQAFALTDAIKRLVVSRR